LRLASSDNNFSAPVHVLAVLDDVVIVKLYLLFKELAGTSDLVYSGNVTPWDIIRDLSKKYPRMGKFFERGDFIVLVNGVPVPDKDLVRIKLSDKDILEILPPASGGSAICY
jgi:molybdopterin converting factor small subunit